MRSPTEWRFWVQDRRRRTAAARDPQRSSSSPACSWSESKGGQGRANSRPRPTGITVSGDPEEIYEVYNSGPLSADLLSVRGSGPTEDSAGRDPRRLGDKLPPPGVAHGRPRWA